MLKAKKRIGIFNLILGILFTISIAIMFFGESASLNAWLDTLPEQNGEGFAIIAVIVYGIYGGAFLVALGIPTIVGACIVLKSGKAGLVKAFTIVPVVTKILAGAILTFYCIVMFETYPAGYVWKVYYIAVALTAIVTAILDIVALAKTKKQPQPVADEAPVQA